MAKLTGNYLYLYLKNKIGAPYTGYLSITLFNRFWEDAFIQGIEKRFQQDQTQKIKDELTQFINTNVTITNIGNNALNLAPIVATSLGRVDPSGHPQDWFAQTNIPFSPLNSTGRIDINGGISKTTLTYPSGRYVITSYGNSVKGTTTVYFTAIGFTGTTADYVTNSATFSLQNTTNLVPAQLIDYVHLLNVKCNFTKPVYVPVVSSSTGGTPITVSLNWYNNLRTSSIKNDVMITMSGWATNTNANGSFYIKKINDLDFQLYADINLQTPIVGIANETASGVTLGYTYYNAARPYLSTEKISNQNTPTEKSPRYETANNWLIFYGDPHLDIPCTEVTIDYICKPKLPYINSQQNDAYSGVYIDGNDNVFDMSTLYSEKLLFSFTDTAGLLFSEFARDQELAQFSQLQIKENP